MLRMKFGFLSGGLTRSAGESNPILFWGWTLFRHQIGWASGALRRMTPRPFPSRGNFYSKSKSHFFPKLILQINQIPFLSIFSLLAYRKLAHGITNWCLNKTKDIGPLLTTPILSSRCSRGAESQNIFEIGRWKLNIFPVKSNPENKELRAHEEMVEPTRITGISLLNSEIVDFDSLVPNSTIFILCGDCLELICRLHRTKTLLH